MSKYDDIINLPHPSSERHPRMSLENRAAQFAPFAALIGHDAAIEETSRYTEGRTELSEDEMLTFSRVLSGAIESGEEIRVRYFIPDAFKDGGRYEDTSGKIIKIDRYENTILLSGGTTVGLDRIVSVSTVDTIRK